MGLDSQGRVEFVFREREKLLELNVGFYGCFLRSGSMAYGLVDSRLIDGQAESC